jgi:hypothetical protein
MPLCRGPSWRSFLERFPQLQQKNRYRQFANAAVPELARSRIEDRRC